MEESSTLFKIMMLALFVIGAALILTRYLFDTPQWMVFAGLGFIMGGLYAATKWR
jgi:positive regulator of sigma E activity